MEPEYRNWIPSWMQWSTGVAAAGLVGANIAVARSQRFSPPTRKALTAGAALASLAGVGSFTWTLIATRAFDYARPDSVARSIVQGIASFVQCPEGGQILDVGCGSGALTIECAKRNPGATVVGIDRWGSEYRDYSAQLCRRNAEAEGVGNCVFQSDDATHLSFADESFDVVTSNYVYHNVVGADKQKLLLETLRVLKKGGTFAIHDLMGRMRYGDMEAFVQRLKDAGYEDVQMIRTSDGLFMEPLESRILQLRESYLLVGTK